MAIGFAIAAIVGSAISVGTTLHSANIAKKTAKSQREANQRVAASQARAQHIQQQRAQRQVRAQLNARQAAAGVIGSPTLGANIAGQTNLAANQAIIEQNLAEQNTQFDLQFKQTVNEANAAIGRSIGSFVSTAATGGEAIRTAK